MASIEFRCFPSDGIADDTQTVNFYAEDLFTMESVLFDKPGEVRMEGKIKWFDSTKPTAMDSQPIDVANMREFYVTTSMFCGGGDKTTYCCEMISPSTKQTFVINSDTNEVIREPLASEYRAKLRKSQMRKCVLVYAYVNPQGGDAMQTDEHRPGDLDIMVSPTPQAFVKLNEVLDNKIPAKERRFAGCEIRTRNKIQNV